MKKKILCTVMLAVMLTSLSACGKKSEDTTETAQTETQTEPVSEAENTKEKKEKVVVDASKYVTLPDYKSMEVTVEPMREITDEDVEGYINNNMLTYYPVTDRAVQEGDIAVIDYVGKKDDVAFEGGTANDFNLTIGSHQFIDGFEEGLIGVSTGETVDLNLTFPEQYHSPELAGKEVVFTVTVKEIKGKADYKTVTEDQLAAMKIGYDNKEDLWKAGQEAYQKEVEEEYKTNVQSAIYDQILEETEFSEIPQELIDEKADEYVNYLEEMCMNNYQVDLKTFLEYSGQDEESYQEIVNSMATEGAKQEMIIQAIATTEELAPTEDEILARAKELAENYQIDSADQFIEMAGKEAFELGMLQEKVFDYLMETVKINDK